MRKMCTLITSKCTDIDENIANQNHATRTPKPEYLNLSTIYCIRCDRNSTFHLQEIMHFLHLRLKCRGFTVIFLG
jgi:hypothetical protein